MTINKIIYIDKFIRKIKMKNIYFLMPLLLINIENSKLYACATPRPEIDSAELLRATSVPLTITDKKLITAEKKRENFFEHIGSPESPLTLREQSPATLIDFQLTSFKEEITYALKTEHFFLQCEKTAQLYILPASLALKQRAIPIAKNPVQTITMIQTTPNTTPTKQELEWIAQLYKIHFMPHDNDYIPFLLRLCRLIRANPLLQTTVNSLKCLITREKDKLCAIMKQEGAPKIVIYCKFGKEEAQKTLNIIYHAFKDIPGLGRTPDFNAKVTDLIYITQGNRTDKHLNSPFFEPSGIYFKANFTGDTKDYHLTHPETGLPLLN